MTSQSNTVQAQVQRLANDITARLAQLAKDPPDLSTYLRFHAECVSEVLQPIGFSYEIVSGNNLQKILTNNTGSLNLNGNPEQDFSFQKAARLAFNNGRQVVVEANAGPKDGPSGIRPEDSPSPENLPVFNLTPFHQFFVPIVSAGTPIGVLHVWFAPADPATEQIRQVLLRHACNEIDLYLRTRKLGDVTQELARLNTYARLLEELAGDLDLDGVSWNIVNFARESVSCDRVCLFVATNYGAVITRAANAAVSYEYELVACSGLKKPHPRSEHAVVLKHLAKKLTELALERSNSTQSASQPPPRTPASTESKSEIGGVQRNAEAKTKAEEGRSEKPATYSSERERKKSAVPQIQLTLVQRDPSKTSTRPQEVNDYFDVLPMNWATVLPLFDRENRVCGIVLFEGLQIPDKLESSFLQMRDLAVSAGRSLGTTLYWNKQRSIQVAQKWISARKKILGTPIRRVLINFVLPVAAVVAVMAMPVTYRVKGHATIVPTEQRIVPVLTSSTLLNVAVREGQLVRKGEVLASLDTTELSLQWRQATQEYQRASIAADFAMSIGNEPQMQNWRLVAAKAQATAEKIERDITNSTLRAPFDGMVLGAQTLGSRIGQYLRLGESALEVINPKNWTVKASLSEQDISFVERFIQSRDGLPAELKLAADPTHAYKLMITNRSQLSYGLEIAEGKYFFGVVLPLQLDEAIGASLKSGFTGRVSIDVTRKPLGYVLFRDFGNFIRLKFL